MPIPEADPGRASICLSDLHLTSVQTPVFEMLKLTLQQAAARGDNVFLLGDLCEVWVGDDDDAELASAFRQLLQQTARHTWVGLMHGNRDFLFGEQLSRDTGAALLPETFRLGSHVLLTHGDQYCIDDQPYQQMRTLLRSPQWQASVMAQTLTERRALAADLRRQSSAANANKAANIMDVNAEAVAEAMSSAHCAIMIHGHTHRPGWHRLADFDRLVLGDWDKTAWVARLAANVSTGAPDRARLRAGIELQCLPFRQ
ncbi:MAG: UDP-2,3-diacylglucosamine diphosphatase [Pseudomonadales bacterium]